MSEGATGGEVTPSVTSVLLIKTGSLGDVLRTTSVLPGLKLRFPGLELTWLVSRAAAPLVERHRLVSRVVTCEPEEASSLDAARLELPSDRWDWVLSLDDEASLCEFAASLDAARLSGATLDEQGQPTYTDDVEPWFGMGLLSKGGKLEADRRKLENQRSHAEIFASMLGVERGRPELPLPAQAHADAAKFARDAGLNDSTLVCGLNTGAGGRWRSKELPVERVVAYAGALATAMGREVSFLVLGGAAERSRNDEILAGLRLLDAPIRVIDAGTHHDLCTFAAILGLSDLLLTSDSLALHLGLAMEVPVVSFFAPTSAAEIDLFGLGEKVTSSAQDYCSYRPEVDRSTITVERLVAASLKVLADHRGRRRLVARS